MPQFSKTHPVNHSALRMFDLVADVEQYPEFVPLCEELVVRSRRTKDRLEILVAEMTVGYKTIRQKFTSQVALDRPGLVIDVHYLDGPFHHLHNKWQFVDTGADRCDILFDIDYEFRSRTLRMLMGAVFDSAFRRFTAAFEKRADDLSKKEPGAEAGSF